MRPRCNCYERLHLRRRRLRLRRRHRRERPRGLGFCETASFKGEHKIYYTQQLGDLPLHVLFRERN